MIVKRSSIGILLLSMSLVWASVGFAGPDDADGNESAGDQIAHESVDQPVTDDMLEQARRVVEDMHPESIIVDMQIPLDDKSTPEKNDVTITISSVNVFAGETPESAIRHVSILLDGADNGELALIIHAKGDGEDGTIIDPSTREATVKDLKRELAERQGIGAVDVTKTNQIFTVARAVGIGGMVFTVGYFTSGESFTRSLFATMFPMMLSAWIQIHRPGFIRAFSASGWEGTKGFFTQVRDYPGYENSQKLENFKLGWLKPFIGRLPAPFILKDHSKYKPAGFFESTGKMIGFIMFYMASSHMGVQLFERYVEASPELAAHAQTQAWLSFDTFMGWFRDANWSSPAELASAVVAGRILTRKENAITDEYLLTGKRESALQRMTKATIASGLMVALCSIVNTMGEIRMAISEFTLFEMPKATQWITGPTFNEGHAIMVGFAITLVGIDVGLSTNFFKRMYEGTRRNIGKFRDLIFQRKDPPGGGGRGCYPWSFMSQK